jgi:hypothetical protein
MSEKTAMRLYWAILAGAIAAVFYLIASVPCQAADAWQPYRSVCEIQVQQGARLGWTGSGTLVAKRDGMGLILSCRHVNKKVGLEVKIVWHGSKKQKVTGRVVHVVPGGGSDWGSDLAVVFAPVPDSLQPVPVAVFDPSAGPWRSVGYRDGRILETIATEGTARGSALVFNSGYLGGMSGGVTFDRYGRQVGVVVASNPEMTIGWSADGENMKQMLARFGR